MCRTCLEQVPSQITSIRFNQPWINTKIKRYSKTKQRLLDYNKARSTGQINDMLKYKQFKCFMQAECCRTHNNYVATTFMTNSPNKNYGHTLKVRGKITVELVP